MCLCCNSTTYLSPVEVVTGRKIPGSHKLALLNFSIEAGILLWGMAGIEPTQSGTPAWTPLFRLIFKYTPGSKIDRGMQLSPLLTYTTLKSARLISGVTFLNNFYNIINS
jgi:hypothetical protein